MKVTERKSEGLYSEFTIEVPPATVLAHINRRLIELGKKAKFDGFRPGKAPKELLLKRYGDAARAEALERVLEETTFKALKEKNIKPAMQPKVDVTKFENDNTLEFTVMVEKMPTVEPADFKKIKIEKPVTPVTDAEIDEALTRVASGYKDSKPIEKSRAAKLGDFVRMNFDGSSNGKKLAGMKAKDFDLELGSGMFVDTFETQIVGAKPGDKMTIKVNFPADYRHPDLAGQPAEFEVEIVEIREAIAPALDDELAKKAGMKSLDDLKKAIKSQMERDYGNLSRAKVKRALLDALDNANKFDVPKGMVDAEYQQIWQYHLQDLKARKMDLAKAEADKESQKEFHEIAERRVRLGLLLSEIGEKAGIKVTNQELNNAIMREAYNYPGQEEKVIKFYQKNPQAVASVRAPIYEEKVVDHILEQIQVTEKQVSKEDLMHDPDEESENERIGKKAAKKK
jgi:trigger factor